MNSSVFPVDLGTLPGGTESDAHAINSTGTVIVGSSGNASVANDINGSGEITGIALTTSTAARAFLWTPRMLDQSGAEAINNEKQVVGWSLGAGLTRVAIWAIK